MVKEDKDAVPSLPKEVVVKKPTSTSSTSPKKKDHGKRRNSKIEKLQKKIKKEAIKRLLKDELKKEMRPLILGSIAMLFSTASNQGMNYFS